MVRAFVALELSDGIREALAEVQDILRQCRARLTFVSPPQIHITIQFLGEVEEARLPSILRSLREIPFHTFPIEAGRVTVNNPRRPFTVWSEITDGGEGARLSTLIGESLTPLGFSKEPRPFVPHATLARVKRFDPSLSETLDEIKDQKYGACTITGMKLKKSILTATGPIYEDLLEVRW